MKNKFTLIILWPYRTFLYYCFEGDTNQSRILHEFSFFMNPNLFIVQRSDEASHKYVECQNELVQQRRKNAMLEKQVGKNKIEQTGSKGGSGEY
jgi:hypothetical protein